MLINVLAHCHIPHLLIFCKNYASQGNSAQIRRSGRVVYGASHRAWQLGEDGPPWSLRIGSRSYTRGVITEVSQQKDNDSNNTPVVRAYPLHVSCAKSPDHSLAGHSSDLRHCQVSTKNFMWNGIAYMLLFKMYHRVHSEGIWHTRNL
jgi:hypothetical protein